LALLVFVSLSFAIKDRGWKRIFYLLCFILFASNVLLSGSRAGALGFAVGLPFFAFLYPNNNNKRVRIFKLASAGLFVLMLLGLFWINNDDNLSKRISENPLGGRAVRE